MGWPWAPQNTWVSTSLEFTISRGVFTKFFCSFPAANLLNFLGGLGGKDLVSLSAGDVDLILGQEYP